MPGYPPFQLQFVFSCSSPTPEQKQEEHFIAKPRDDFYEGNYKGNYRITLPIKLES